MPAEVRVNRKISVILALHFAVAIHAAGIDGPVQISSKTQGESKAGPSPIPSVALQVKSAVYVANTYAAILSQPIRCGPEGELYATIFRVLLDAPQNSAVTHLGIDRDGKAFLSVTPDKITDVENPRMGDIFPAADGFYLLVVDRDPKRTRSEQSFSEAVIRPADSHHTFIARFDRDGDYRGRTRIDLPISALQLGVFPTGQFVIAGMDDLNHQKLVLLKPSGDIDRCIELPQKSDQASASHKQQGPRQNDLVYAGMFSQLVADDDRLLLISRASGSVFSISPTGLAEEIHLASGAQGIMSLQAVPEGWFVSLHSAGEAKSGVVGRLFDRKTGKLIRNYTMSGNPGAQPGCMRAGGMSFLRSDSESRLELLIAAPADK